MACLQCGVQPGTVGGGRWADAVGFPRMTWLVTGGAGRVGAYVVVETCAVGDAVVVFDNLSCGDR
jgi:hypothetical protein